VWSSCNTDWFVLRASELNRKYLNDTQKMGLKEMQTIPNSAKAQNRPLNIVYSLLVGFVSAVGIFLWFRVMDGK